MTDMYICTHTRICTTSYTCRRVHTYNSARQREETEKEIEQRKWKKKKLEKKLAANYLEGLHRETRNQGWSVT